MFEATIRHYSISRAPVVKAATVAAAKRAATKAFGEGFIDHEIVISDRDGYMVARRRIGDRRWRDAQ